MSVATPLLAEAVTLVGRYFPATIQQWIYLVRYLHRAMTLTSMWCEFRYIEMSESMPAHALNVSSWNFGCDMYDWKKLKSPSFSARARASLYAGLV
jgi:hypothetical protein